MTELKLDDWTTLGLRNSSMLLFQALDARQPPTNGGASRDSQVRWLFAIVSKYEASGIYPPKKRPRYFCASCGTQHWSASELALHWSHESHGPLQPREGEGQEEGVKAE